MADGHLAEALLGALGVLEAQVAGHLGPVCVGLLGHVVEDGFDEAEFVVAEAADGRALGVVRLLGRHGGRLICGSVTDG